MAKQWNRKPIFYLSFQPATGTKSICPVAHDREESAQLGHGSASKRYNTWLVVCLMAPIDAHKAHSSAPVERSAAAAATPICIICPLPRVMLITFNRWPPQKNWTLYVVFNTIYSQQTGPAINFCRSSSSTSKKCNARNSELSAYFSGNGKERRPSKLNAHMLHDFTRLPIPHRFDGIQSEARGKNNIYLSICWLFVETLSTYPSPRTGQRQS